MMYNKVDKYVKAVVVHESIFSKDTLNDIYGGV